MMLLVKPAANTSTDSLFYKLYCVNVLKKAETVYFFTALTFELNSEVLPEPGQLMCAHTDAARHCQLLGGLRRAADSDVSPLSHSLPLVFIFTCQAHGVIPLQNPQNAITGKHLQILYDLYFCIITNGTVIRYF